MPKTSLTDRAYHSLKDSIVHYQLKPGSSLRFAELSKMLQMSQTPIREAVCMLEREGLVRRHGQKGYVVSTLDLNEVKELYDFRIILEVAAARSATQRMSATDHDQMAYILSEVESLISKREKGQSLELEQRFHAIILMASGNRFLSETGQSILDRIWMVQNFNMLTSDRLGDAHQQHEAIFHALEIGDADQAAALMHRHITVAKNHIIQRLENGNDILSNLIISAPNMPLSSALEM